jgi:excisionase family DNA binding protein
MKELLTPKQVARAIGVSEASLKRWCDKGLIPAIRTVGGHRRLPINGVIQFLRSTQRPMVRPGVLGLPATTGLSDGVLERSQGRMQEALEAGDPERCRAIAFDLYLAGHAVVDICDKVLAASFRALGDRWEHGDLEVYQERLACEITMRVLLELRAVLASPAVDAPYALGGTLGPDPYTLATTMVETALREAGWRAQSHGVGIPAETYCAAIRDKAPALFWLSVSTLESVPKFVAQYRVIHEAASTRGVPVAVGGRALTEDIRQQLAYSAFGDNLRHLVTFARTLYFPSKVD